MEHRNVMSAVRQSILDWMVGDCWRAVEGRAMVGALILAVCAIDTRGSLLAGKGGSNKTFKDFAARYLPRCEEYTDDVYDGMRNRLVHNYSSRGFVYTDGNPELHLIKTRGGDLILNVESFVEDVQRAAEAYIADLEEDAELYRKYIKRTKDQGYKVLGPVHVVAGGQGVWFDWPLLPKHHFGSHFQSCQ